jgi:general secretion pathway protein F
LRAFGAQMSAAERLAPNFGTGSVDLRSFLLVCVYLRSTFLLSVRLTEAMPRFAYKSVSASGEVAEGVLEAPSRAGLIEELRRQGQMPIRAEEIGAGGGLRFTGLRATRGLSAADLAQLTRELATLLKAGLPVDRALAFAADLETKGPRAKFLKSVLEAVKGGATLADAMARPTAALPPYYIGMIRAGEAGGTLDAVLARLAETLERAQALRETVQSALYYPVIVLFLAGVTLIILLTAVIPQFAPLFEEAGDALPASMALLLAVGGFLERWWWVLMVLLLVFLYGGRWLGAQPDHRRRWDGAMLRLPVLGDLLRKVEVARFCRTLGTLLANGVTAVDAFGIAAGAVGNRALAAVIAEVTPRLRRGEGLALPLLESAAFPRLAVQLAKVGEESGQLDQMLLRTADIYDEEVKRAVQRLTSLLVPLVTIALGLLVAAIIGSMLDAILSTYDLSQ